MFLELTRNKHIIRRATGQQLKACNYETFELSSSLVPNNVRGTHMIPSACIHPLVQLVPVKYASPAWIRATSMGNQDS
jgi:hypothetical protein